MTAAPPQTPLVSPPAASGPQVVPPEVCPPHRDTGGATAPDDAWWWLRGATAACGCCAVLVENEAQLREIRARHPEKFTGEPEPPPDHPDVEIEHLIEQGRGLPVEEREHGLRYEAWL